MRRIRKLTAAQIEVGAQLIALVGFAGIVARGARCPAGEIGYSVDGVESSAAGRRVDGLYLESIVDSRFPLAGPWCCRRLNTNPRSRSSSRTDREEFRTVSAQSAGTASRTR